MAKSLTISAHGETHDIPASSDADKTVDAMLDWLEESNAADWTNDGRTVHGVHWVDGKIDRDSTGNAIRAVYGLDRDK